MEKEPKFISKEEVKPEEQEKLEKLEIDTDELYRLQVEMWSSIDAISEYIPELKKRRWKKVKDHETDREVVVYNPASWRDFLILRKLQKSNGGIDKIIEKFIENNIPENEEWLNNYINTYAEDSQQCKTLLSLPVSEKRAIAVEQEREKISSEIENINGIWEQINQSRNDPIIKKYKVFRLEELKKAEKEISDTDIKRAIIRLHINQMVKNDEAVKFYTRYQQLLEKDRQLAQSQNDIYMSSPEAYLWKTYQNLLEIKNTFDEHGTIVETPYVKEKIAHILDEIKERPVFIHGELSTGKTELAKHVARKYLSRLYLERWEKENPKPKDPEALKEWERAREEAMEPLEIRGMRGLEKEDVLARTVLEREKTPLPEEQVKFLMRARENFRKEVIEKAAESIQDPKEREEFIKSSLERLEEGYMEKWKSGIITVEQLSPIFQAMKDGRPVIIDEMNAIPHHVLIVLNDVINKKPGQKVYTPTGEQITVEEGFALIATGNWKPEDSVLYPGRATLDAAYLSRFGIEDYDFLPQSIQRENETIDPEALRKERQENELFMVMMTRLLDNQLGVKLPEGSIDKIKELTRMARILQDVFSEKAVDRTFWARGGKINPKDVLRENVLAYRQLFPILERWKKDGFVRPLDDYIFLEYVQRSSARPQEMKYIYNLLQTQGDFFQGEDWPRSTGESDADISQIKNYNIIRKIYGVDTLSQAKKAIPKSGLRSRYYSPKEVIEEIFGPIPERKRYRVETLETKTSEEAVERAREELEVLGRFKESLEQDLKDLKQDIEVFCQLKT